MPICGGIIKESEWNKAVEEGTADRYLMCFILPDDKYEEYFRLLEEGKDREAEEIFYKHAWSVI